MLLFWWLLFRRLFLDYFFLVSACNSVLSFIIYLNVIIDINGTGKTAIYYPPL